jgi:hypothetical protein
MAGLIEYMNTFANYGTLACLIWLVYELKDIRRRDDRAALSEQLLAAINTLQRHYHVEEVLKDEKDSHQS